MITKTTIAIKKLSEEHLQAICVLLGFTMKESLIFTQGTLTDCVQIDFDDETLDKNPSLIIRETGEIYVIPDYYSRDNIAVNTIPVVLYLKENNLLV